MLGTEDLVEDSLAVRAKVSPAAAVFPEQMLAEINRHSRFTAEEFAALATEEPVDVPALHRRIRSMIEAAESFIAKLPSDAVGVIFMDGDKPVQPDVNALDKYQRNPGAPRGLWPSSPDIARARCLARARAIVTAFELAPASMLMPAAPSRWRGLRVGSAGAVALIFAAAGARAAFHARAAHTPELVAASIPNFLGPPARSESP